MSIEPRALLSALVARPVVSGRELAERLGVTRAAIWKQIEALRQLGAPIDARAGSGYALQAPIDLLDAHAIAAGLSAETARCFGHLDVRWQVDSTSSELLREAPRSGRDLIACFAEIQSAGRGRRGRQWHSSLGGGLAFSVFRRFESGMAGLSGLSLAVGIGVVRALEDFGYSGIGLKWPNDLCHRGRKLAGILVELGGDALGPCHAVIGVGINVRLDAHRAGRVDQPWTDLARLRESPPPNRNQVAARLLERLREVLDMFDRSSFSSFVDTFAQYDVLRGQRVQISAGSAAREGIAVGVDRHGALCVRTQDGEIVVDSGEVSVRARPGSSR